MNETEQIELLQAVAECAPKEWDARAIVNQPNRGGYDDCVFFATADIGLYLPDDSKSAEAIIAMLDAMDAFGLISGVYKSQGGYYYCVASFPRENPKIIDLGAEMFTEEGATRAEAAARAFVAVFASPPPALPAGPAGDRERWQKSSL